MTMRLPPLMAALCLAAATCGHAQTTATPATTAKPATGTAKPAANGANGAKAVPAPATAIAAAPSPAPAIVVKPAASAPLQAKRQTRPLTSAEKLESVAPPGELRPERTITPQITIPLNKTPPDSVRAQSRTSSRPVNDSAGQCAAIADENQRAMCREAAGLGKPTK